MPYKLHKPLNMPYKLHNLVISAPCLLPHSICHCIHFLSPELTLQHGKVAIVTGGTRGIGYETSRHMASLGAHVIKAGQNELEGVSAVKRICEENREAKGNTHSPHSPVCFRASMALDITDWSVNEHTFLQLDLASLQSVRQSVQNIKRWGLPLHILVNNAAVMLVPEGRTEEGFEHHFRVNYLGHFLLALLLLDTLKHSGKRGSCSRVVALSSSAHGAGEIRLDSLQCYSAHAAYCQSKLALLLFSSHLQQRLDRGGFPVSSCAVDPGMVDTPSQGASTVLYTALSPSLEGEGGACWSNGRTEMTSPNTYDPQLHRGLWDSSCRQVVLIVTL
uniref:Dehydrogenase/reductase (SDR family) X-linked n=1 Tax=Salmo trutta TaxID=8032 RepID=A0A674CIK6_SALTR